MTRWDDVLHLLELVKIPRLDLFGNKSLENQKKHFISYFARLGKPA
jgi:hypothetical protein